MYALSHIDETFTVVEHAISDSWNHDVVNGDWNSRAKWVGNVEMQVKLAITDLFIETKGVGEIPKIGKFSRVGKTLTLSESVNFIQGIKNAINFDKYKQSVDMLNDILMPKNQLALADTNGFNLKPWDYNTFNEAKDTFLFFDKFKSHPNSIYKNNGSVEHIFHGNVNQRGAAGGFYHESMPSKGKIRSITEEPDEHGMEIMMFIDSRNRSISAFSLC